MLGKTLYQFANGFLKPQTLPQTNSELPRRGNCEENQLKKKTSRLFLFQHGKKKSHQSPIS